MGVGHVGSHLGFTHLDTPEAILVCLVELHICENLYFATNFIKLSALEQKIWTFIDFGSHLGCHIGSHLGFSYLDTMDVILLHIFDLLILKNLYIAANFMKLFALEQ